MNYNIDKPVAADFPQLLVVWEASVRATHHFVPEEKIPHLKNLIKQQQLFQKSDLYCVRNAAGEVAGFAGVAGDSLDMLFVDPQIIGKGAGKALMRYAIDVKGVLRVDVNEQNEHALGFYKHFGFEVVGRSETDDNGEPFPLLHMARRDGLVISEVTLAHLTNLIAISQQTYSETFFEAFNDPEGFKEYTTEIFAFEQMKTELANPHSLFYFALRGDRIVGYIKLNFAAAQTINHGERAAEIERIYVLAEYQNQHIGKALLDHAVVIARNNGFDTVWLAVWENNAKAIRFYERHGFKAFDTHTYLVAGDAQTDRVLKLPVNK